MPTVTITCHPDDFANRVVGHQWSDPTVTYDPSEEGLWIRYNYQVRFYSALDPALVPAHIAPRPARGQIERQKSWPVLSDAVVLEPDWSAIELTGSVPVTLASPVAHAAGKPVRLPPCCFVMVGGKQIAGPGDDLPRTFAVALGLVAA